MVGLIVLYTYCQASFFRFLTQLVALIIKKNVLFFEEIVLISCVCAVFIVPLQPIYTRGRI